MISDHLSGTCASELPVSRRGLAAVAVGFLAMAGRTLTNPVSGLKNAFAADTSWPFLVEPHGLVPHENGWAFKTVLDQVTSLFTPVPSSALTEVALEQHQEAVTACCYGLAERPHHWAKNIPAGPFQYVKEGPPPEVIRTSLDGPR